MRRIWIWPKSIMDIRGPNLLVSNPLTNHGILNPLLHALHYSHVSPPLSSSAPQALLLSLFLTATQKNAKAGAYENKVIDIWEDIEILCERDRAIGIGVEHMNEAVKVMVEE